MENEYQNFYEQPAAENVGFEAPAPEKKNFTKLIGVAVAAVVAIIALILIIGGMSNNYKAPVKAMEKLANTTNFAKYEKAQIAQFNGLCKKEIKGIYDLQKKSDDYDKGDAKDEFNDMIDEKEDSWGKDFEITYDIKDKEKIDRDDLKDLQEEIRDSAKDALDDLNDLDSDDIEEIADELGISKSQAKKLVNYCKSICKEMKKAKVSGGYELELKYKLKGKELDDPVKSEYDIEVYKINGRWVSASILDSLMAMTGLF